MGDGLVRIEREGWVGGVDGEIYCWWDNVSNNDFFKWF